MKKLIVLCGAAAVVFSSCNTTGGGLKSEEDTLAYMIGMSIGSQMRGQDSTLNVDVVAQGMKAAIKGDSAKMKFTQAEMMEFMQEYYTVRKPRKDSMANVEYLAGVEKSNQNVKKTESGLLYEIVEEGDMNAKADSASVVFVKYTLSDKNGKQIESNMESEDSLKMDLSTPYIIAGFKEGAKLVGKGGQIKLWIPAELGYGSRAMGPIAANSVLLFDVKLLDVQPAEQPAAKK